MDRYRMRPGRTEVQCWRYVPRGNISALHKLEEDCAAGPLPPLRGSLVGGHHYSNWIGQVRADAAGNCGTPAMVAAVFNSNLLMLAL